MRGASRPKPRAKAQDRWVTRLFRPGKQRDEECGDTIVVEYERGLLFAQGDSAPYKNGETSLPRVPQPRGKPRRHQHALNTFGDCGLSFEVTGPSGRSIPQNFIFPSRRLSPYGPKDFRKLDSGKVFRMEIRVDNWFQLDEPGQYSVRVSYWNRYEGRWFDQAVWTGTTPKSPVTTLRIH